MANFDAVILIDGYESSLANIDCFPFSPSTNIVQGITIGDVPVGTVYYKMRGRDSGRTAPGYVTWVVINSTDFTGAHAAGNCTPSLLGSIIAGSTVLVDQW